MGQQARSQVTARVHERSTLAPSSDLMGLVAGLQGLNPELSKAWEGYQADQRQDAVDQARMAEAKDPTDSRDALTGAPVEVPAVVPPAFGDVYRDTYRNLRTQRAALSIGQDILGEYEGQKNSPEFNPQAFLADKRRDALQGLKDPTQVGIMDSHLTQLEQRIGADYQGLLIKRHEAERKSTMFTMTEQALDPIMEPEHIAERGHWLVSQGAGIQVLPQDAGRAIVRRVRSMAGDRPELFDAFDVPDADGNTLRSKFPELSEEIDTGRRQAEAARDKAVHEATEQDRFDTRVSLDRMVNENPEFLASAEGMEALRAQIGPNGLSANQAAAYVDAAHTAIARKRIGEDVTAAANAGTLGRYKPEDQQKALESMVGGILDTAWNAATGQGDATPEQRQGIIMGLAQKVMEVQTKAGATVPVEALSRLLNSSVTSLPSPDGPSPAFLASAEMFRALEPNPQFRDLYFNDRASDLMQTYARLAYLEGLEPATAYEQAYHIHSPENQERMKARQESPTFYKDMEAVARKAAAGSAVFRITRDDGTTRAQVARTPKNDDVLRMWASMRARDVFRQNPHLTEGEVLAKVERMVRRSFVYDTSSQRAIEIPAGIDSEVAQAAFSDLSETLAKQYRDKNLIDGDGYVTYAKVPGGSDAYRIMVNTGTGESKGGEQVRLGQIIDRYRAKHMLSREEAMQLHEANLMAQAGEDVRVDPVLLEKGRQSNYVRTDDPLWAKARETRIKEVLGKLEGPAAFTLSPPTGNNTVKPRSDRQTTVTHAMDFAFSGGHFYGKGHMDLAASLVTAREGVMLSAYGDPAKGAGLNVGAGYNLKANAATAAADLKAVGVPAERVPDVQAGKAALTPDQVKALTKLTIQRFEPQVIKAAEAAKPGLWQSLTPQQRAVMLDVAYQTGDPGSYSKALTSVPPSSSVPRPGRLAYRWPPAEAGAVRRSQIARPLPGKHPCGGLAVAWIRALNPSFRPRSLPAP